MTKGANEKEVTPPLTARSIPIYQSANQPQPTRVEDANSEFKVLEMFINVMGDDYTISILMPDIIMEHDHMIYIDKYEIMQFYSRNEIGGSIIFVYI